MMTGLPIRGGLRHATVASLVACASAVVASILGLASGADRYAHSQSVLVSQGADAANLLAVLVVLVTLARARRGSLPALLLWPGGLFYLVYAFLPYLFGAPFTPLLLDDVVAFLAGAYAVAALALGIDTEVLRARFVGAPARTVGSVLAAVGVLAYAGLIAAALAAFGSSTTEAAWRGHWVADWILGTPALIVSGILLWARRPFGYLAAPALLLVSALGGVVFASAGVVNNVIGGVPTEPAVIVVHLVISGASAAVLVRFLAAPRRAAAPGRRAPRRPSTTPRAT